MKPFPTVKEILYIKNSFVAIFLPRVWDYDLLP